MTLVLDDDAKQALAPLGSRLRSLIDTAHDEAVRLHSSELTVEHLLCAAMRDEDCAAYDVVCHAFADPDTIYEETLALAPGLLVVASASTLPFSPGSVLALHAAYSAAREAGTEVDTSRVLAEARAASSEGQRQTLDGLGFRSSDLPEPASPPGWPRDAGSFFASFDETAKRAVSGSNRVANSLRSRSIAPAHLLLGCLQADESLASRTGLTFSRARMALAHDHEDATPAEARDLRLGADLRSFLSGLPAGSDTLAFLAALHSPATEDVSNLLGRHKVSADLLKRSEGAFTDPA